MIRNLFDYNYILGHLADLYGLHDTLDVVDYPSSINGRYDAKRDVNTYPFIPGKLQYRFHTIVLKWEFNALIRGNLKINPTTNDKMYLLAMGGDLQRVDEELWVSEIETARQAYRFHEPSRTALDEARCLCWAWEQGGLFQ